jgi:membrane protein DedA with SNARE-associated domain
MQWLNDVVMWIVHAVGTVGYPGIFLLMFLESTFFPLPSEIIIPPAAYLASQGQMNIFAIIILGTVGNLAGALFNYYLSIKLGRPLIKRMLGYLHFGERSYEIAEHYFREHGEISTFIGRLIPGVRHFISMPAGLARMNITRFTIFTLLGAGIWITILAWIGYYIGNNQQLITQYSNQILVYIALAIAVVLVLYIWWYKKK